MDAVLRDTGTLSGPFRLQGLLVDPESGSLTGSNGTVRIEPRAAQVLVALARTPNQLVGRHVLLEEIWPGGEIYDDALTQCVYQLRQHLVQASGDEQLRKIIQTVPKRGYILQANLEPLVAAKGLAVGAADDRTGVAANQHKTRNLRLAVSALLLLSAVLGGWIWWTNLRSPMAGPPVSIAVLPFLPLMEVESDPVLEQGMADTLISRLSQVPGTVVRPISSVRYFSAPDRDPLVAGRELDVDSVVDGSLLLADGVLRVNVRLLRVTDGVALWSDSFEQPFTQIFSLQDTMAARIAEAMKTHLDPDAVEDRKSGTPSMDAYGLYLEGRYNLSLLSGNHLLIARERFDHALAIDPDYKEAWLGLANTLFRLPIVSEVAPLEHYPLAKQAAERALQLDPREAEAYAYLGWIAQWYEWDWQASEAHFLRGIELDPNETEVHFGYAHLLGVLGRKQEALVEIRRARELSPLYMNAAAIEGGMLNGLGRYQEAADGLEQVIRIDPDFWLTHQVLAEAYSSLGRSEEALEQLRMARALNDRSRVSSMAQIPELLRLGRRTEAEAILAEFLQSEQERYVHAYFIAGVCLDLGNLECAMNQLQRAVENRDPSLIFLPNQPRWNILQDRPEFLEILRLLNFPSRPGET